jgi:hypothetical protein
VNGLSTVLIGVGLFLVGGTISFRKQGMPRQTVVLLGLAAVFCLVAGLLRLEV